MIDFETRGRETDYITIIKSNLTDDLGANHGFLTKLYNERKKVVDQNWDKAISILERKEVSKKEVEYIEGVYHLVLQQYSSLYWLREGYMEEQAKKLDDSRSGGKTDKTIFEYIDQKELDEISERVVYLESLIEQEIVKKGLIEK